MFEFLQDHACPHCLDLSAHGSRQLLQVAIGDHSSHDLGRMINQILDSARITIPSLANEYFATIHRHLPVVDEGNFRARLLSWPRSGGAEFALLLWACNLVTRRPCPDNAHTIRDLWYRTSKRVFMLKAAESPTVELLQAGLIITYYECGHGLPREAHMTLSASAAISRLMGLQVEELSDASSPYDERWACRKALVLLDRTIGLSSLDRPVPLLFSPNQDADTDTLALQSEADTTYKGFDISSTVALSIGEAVGQANEAQLGRLEGSNYRDIYNRLESLVCKLMHAAKTAPDTHVFCEGTLLAVSALLVLQASNTRRDALWAESREAMHLQSMLRMVRDTYQASTHMVCDGYASRISVMALCAMVRAAALFVRLCGTELGDEDLENLRFNLESFGTRWTIGRVCLQDFDKAVIQSRATLRCRSRGEAPPEGWLSP